MANRPADPDLDLSDAIRQEAMAFAGIGWFAFTFDGRILSLDTAAFQILELQGRYPGASSVVGENIADIVQYDTQGLLRNEIRMRGRVRNLEWRLVTPRGNEKWLSQDAYLCCDALSGEESIQVVVRDVTETRRVMRALEQSEALFWAASEGSADGFFALRALRGEGGRIEDFQFDYINRRAAVFFGMQEDEAAKRLLGEVVPFGREKVIARYAAVAETQMFFESEYHFDPPRNGVAWVREHVLPLADGVAVSCRDISERMRVEERLRASEERLRLAFQQARMGAWEWNVENGHIMWSEELERLFGIPTGSFDGKFLSFAERLYPDDRAATEEAVERVVSAPPGGDDAYAMEHRIVRPDGEIVWLESLGKLIRNAAGKPARMMGVSRDITERKQAEAERRTLELQLQHAQKLESLGVLAGGIAHDFNNLLTGVMGNIELAIRALPDAPSRRYLDAVQGSARRAADLCRQMLAYSGQGKIAIERLNLNRIVEEMMSLLHASISKKAALEFSPGAELPDVLGDAAQVCQVAMNLITNASEAMGNEDGRILVETGTVDADDDYFADAAFKDVAGAGRFVYLRVEDSGQGMDAKTARRIFDPFFTTKFTGRGLGLSAVLGIMRSHGGAIRIETAPGKGAVFTVYFPACASWHDRPEPPARIPEPSTATGTILLVDDEPAIRQVIAEYLDAFGFGVLVAADGQEAVEVFAERSGELHAVVLDLTMPRKNGDEAFAEMHAINSGVPVILTSGYGEEGIAARFRDMGIADFLQKPYQGAELLARIRGVVGRQA